MHKLRISTHPSLFLLGAIALTACITPIPSPTHPPTETAAPAIVPRPTRSRAAQLAETLQPLDNATTTIRPSPTPAQTSSPYTETVEITWDVYHPDPQHLWNRLFRQFYGRMTKDGREYGRDALDPLLWYDTTYLLEGHSHQQAIQLLDEFLSIRGERLIAEPLKRAMLQRDMWAIFDWLALRSDDQEVQRRALQQRLAQVIQVLALPEDEIRSLPDNYEAAVNSQSFPMNYQDENPGLAFLPPDLLRPGGEWVCLGRESGPIAMTHTEEFPFFGRSVFLVFIRVPSGREATLNYLRDLNLRSTSSVPAGTEVALVRRMLLIDEQGDMVPSPLVESVQIRHFVSSNTQRFFEFTLSRERLFAWQTGGLRPLDSSDKEFILFRSQGFDWFGSNSEEAEHGRFATLRTCTACHIEQVLGITGAKSILSYSRQRFPLPDQQQPVLMETTPGLEAQAVISWKLKQGNWQALQALWHESP